MSMICIYSLGYKFSAIPNNGAVKRKSTREDSTHSRDDYKTNS